MAKPEIKTEKTVTPPAGSTEAQTTDKKQTFFIQAIYIKDFSFESPNAPDIFKQRAKPKVTLDMNNTINALEDDLYEVTLTITVTVKEESDENRTAFLAEIKQAGLFNISGLDKKILHYTLNSRCPEILYPYARANITDVVVRGGFPQFTLTVVNFDAIYRQQLKKEQADREGAEASQAVEKT